MKLAPGPRRSIGTFTDADRSSLKFLFMKTSSDPNPPLDARPWHYAPTAVLLHWTVAALVVFMAALGWYMISIERQPGAGWYFNLHRSIGAVAALLVVARLLFRWKNKPAPLPASMPVWQARVATAVQALLYVLLVALPVTGYVGSSYGNGYVQVFGIETPRWTLKDKDLGESFYGIHSILVWVLVALVAAHVLGALKHLLLDKDGVFQRMWFAPKS